MNINTKFITKILVMIYIYLHKCGFKIKGESVCVQIVII